MGLLGDLIKTVSDVVTSGRRRGGAPSREAGRRGGRRPASTPTARSSPSSSVAAGHGHPARERARSSRADAEVSPGAFGPNATVEVDPHRIGPVRMSYSPQTDGAPDPGEVVWTWVPYEENDGRGKDRPVLVVAVESAGTYLAAANQQGSRRRGRLCIRRRGRMGRRAPAVLGQPGPGDPGARGRDAPRSGGPAARAVRAGHGPAASALRLALAFPRTTTAGSSPRSGAWSRFKDPGARIHERISGGGNVVPRTAVG